MSEFSDVFDQLADALTLKSAGKSPSTTQRQHRPSRRHARAVSFEQVDQAPEPTPLEPVVVSRKPARQVDRSRDRAVYAAPHRPIRPHFYSRPDDIATERVPRPIAIVAAKETGRSLRTVTIAFGASVALGLGAAALFFALSG